MQQNYDFNFIASNTSYNSYLYSITIYVMRESLEKLWPPWLMDLDGKINNARMTKTNKQTNTYGNIDSGHLTSKICAKHDNHHHNRVPNTVSFRKCKAGTESLTCYIETEWKITDLRLTGYFDLSKTLLDSLISLFKAFWYKERYETVCSGL